LDIETTEWGQTTYETRLCADQFSVRKDTNYKT